jgi:hypothetical protein
MLFASRAGIYRYKGCSIRRDEDDIPTYCGRGDLLHARRPAPDNIAFRVECDQRAFPAQEIGAREASEELVAGNGQAANEGVRKGVLPDAVTVGQTERLKAGRRFRLGGRLDGARDAVAPQDQRGRRGTG